MKLAVFDIENWREIGATLMRNKTRTFLTGFGIFWGVAMLAMLTGGARGGEDVLKRNFAGFATNTAAMVTSNTTLPYKGFQKGRSWQMDLTDISLIKETFPEIDAIVPSYSANGGMSHGRHSFQGEVNGVEPDYLRIVNPRIYEGRFINEADMTGERRVTVIGKKIAMQLFPDGASPVGKVVEMMGTAYRVVGVAGNVSEVSVNSRADESAFIPSTVFRKVNGIGDKVSVVYLTGKRETDLSELLPRIQRVVYRRHDIHPTDTGAMYVANIAEMFKEVETVFTGIDILAWFIGLSTLMAGIIGIGNIMWVIVKERTQEIGIRRAIGATPRDIIVQVLSEGVILTLIAGTAGICFAALALGVTEHLANPEDAVSMAHFQMSISTAAGILALFILLGTLAGLVPSIKAMRIKPVEAINDK